jgi:hypothetical protein
MKNEEGGPPLNVIDLTRRRSGPTPLTSVMMLQGLELIRVFLTIASADRRNQVVEFAKRIAADDTGTNT